MKILRSISLYFLYPLGVLLIGIWIGVQTEHFFYPGSRVKNDLNPQNIKTILSEDEWSESTPEKPEILSKVTNADGAVAGVEANLGVDTKVNVSASTGTGTRADASAEDGVDVTQVANRGETLSADTEYVLQEMDLLRGTEVETSWELPKQYIGMNRERFMAAVQNYSDYPPLGEMERGFVNAEVISFARARVVVRKSYQYIQPGEGFYLAVKDNEVVVYLEDKETVYMNTGILLETLPKELQKQIIQTIHFEDEGSLYGFLESYSS